MGMGKLAVQAAVNMGRLPLTREKWVGYRVEWEIRIAFYKTTRLTSSLTSTRRLKLSILRLIVHDIEP